MDVRGEVVGEAQLGAEQRLAGEADPYVDVQGPRPVSTRHDGLELDPSVVVGDLLTAQEHRGVGRPEPPQRQ